MHRFAAVFTVFLCLHPAHARQESQTCGTHQETLREQLHLHERSQQAARARVRTLGAAAPRSVQPDVGDIAVIDDADGVVARRNPFNLQSRTVRFTPVPSGYRYETQGDTYDPQTASSGEILTGIGDDDTREVSLPFPFGFYGQTWRSVWVNSDGNLTFGAGDSAVSERSLGKMTAGPPRIAGLFRDLDPTRSRDGIHVTSTANQFTVSWVDVPEFRDFGTGPLQTFQIRLHRDNRIEIAFSRVTTLDAVVGIAPGRLQGQTAVVSFSNTPTGTHTGAIVERFSGAEDVDLFTAAQKFYLTHEDSYDYLVFYNALGISAGSSNTVAFQTPIRNNRWGYGDVKLDVGLETGSRRRLQTILNMGPLEQYPLDPNAVVSQRSISGDTPLTVLGHEAGHLFLAYASVRDANDPDARPMLGRDFFHWNFAFNSDASLVEGNRIRDNGPGSSPRFETTATVQGFSALDQYLMGLLPPEEVPDTFVVERANVSSSRPPQVGVGFNGERRDIRIEEIIAVEGRRIPDSTVAQRRFRFAFVLIVPAGAPPSPEHIAQIEAYRAAFEPFFARVTGGGAVAETSLKRALHTTVFPAAGVVHGRAAFGKVAVERPRATPLTLVLRPRNGFIQVPSTVTIPAGQVEARFEIRGDREGVDELTIEAPGLEWERITTRIQVLSPAQAQLYVVAGTPPQPVLVRMTDINDLWYPGVTIRASAEGGSVSPAVATADETGVAVFRWTPGATVTFSIEGGPSLVFGADGRLE